MIVNLLINYTNTESATPQAAYTNESGSTISIDSFTASDPEGITREYAAYITKAGELPIAPIIPHQFVVRNSRDLGSGLIGHAIPANGGVLWLQTNVAGGISFTVSGTIST